MSDPSSATRRTGRVDCNRSAPASAWLGGSCAAQLNLWVVWRDKDGQRSVISPAQIRNCMCQKSHVMARTTATVHDSKSGDWQLRNVEACLSNPRTRKAGLRNLLCELLSGQSPG